MRKAGQWRLICPPLHQGGTGGQKPVPGGTGGQKPVPGGPALPGRARGAGPRVTSKQAGAAIASARRIVRILNDFDQDPDVAAEFAAIAPNGRRDIHWSEFCRGCADADQLAQALLDGTAAPIPHAVWGPVHSAEAAGRNHDSYVVQHQATNPVHIDGKPVRLRVAVRSTQADWIGATTRSGRVRPRTPRSVPGPDDLENWSQVLDALVAGRDASWMDDGRNPEIRFEPSGQVGVVVVAVEDLAGSGTSVRVPVRMAQGWATEHRGRLRRVRAAWPQEVVETSPVTYGWRR
ncbi:DUF5959 family protein [Streptomyces sp. NPDC048512]|uniref:DUF5959 family protein n=1 Tax=Streptomyces sp. NPDC048512 TaxID=3365563 RepID=UPI00371581C1